MATVQDGADWPRRRDREDVRAKILEAAQRLYDRIGTNGFTLSAVAGEAGLGRATLYGHYSSRQDLLAHLRTQEKTESAAEEPSPEPEAGDSDSEVAEAERVAEAPANETSTPAPAEEPAVPPPAETPVEDRYDHFMRAQAQALDQLAKQVIVPKPARREGTDAALSRVEARMSVAEQSIAAMEQSLADKLKRLVEGAAGLAASLEETKQRLEKFEQRQQAELARLRLDLHNLGSDASQNPLPPPPEPAPVCEPSAPESAPAEEPQPESTPSRVCEYLSNARQAAINAAQATTPPRPPRRKFRLAWRKHWPMLVVAGVLTAAFDTYVFVHYQPARADVVTAAPAGVPAKPAKRRTLSPEAQFVHGLNLLNGTGVPTNVEKAAVWLERAARNGHAVAQNYVGVLYQTGTGVRANAATAVRWYEASARNGNLKAMTNLGKAYAGGWQEGTDFTKAAEWFGRAAGFGDVDAQFNLAVLYERGEGVSRSISEAYKWYVIAGSRGDANAASRATILEAQLSSNELLAAQAAAALFRPAKTDGAANEVSDR